MRVKQQSITPERLAELKAMPYKEYLKTGEWARTRWGALQRAGNRCVICNSSHDLTVHHRTYARLGQEAAGDLTVLCRQCHDLFTRHGRLVRDCVQAG